jgi:hypothetical protein
MNIFTRIIFAAVCSVSSCAISAATIPGHYIVVTVDDVGKVTPVFYRPVRYSSERAESSMQLKATELAGDQLIATSPSGWSEVSLLPQMIRGEFAKNGKRGEIESYEVENTEKAFALRIPETAGDKITLNYMGKTSRLSVNEVVARANKLKLASFKPKPSTRERTQAANSSNRVDILVMGDGYTAAEQALFNTDAENLRTQMFNYTPYKEYANLVNWTTNFIASSQSGSDHPPYQAGCTATSCCADSAAQSDPRAAGAGTFVNTAFDGKFCTSQIHRLVTINYSKVYAAASAVPDYDVIMILLNDPVYGGSGGSIAVTTTNASANLILIHEYGHTFHDLADEYTSAYPGFPACSDTGGAAICEANVTNQTDPNLIKWRSWIAPGQTIPTPVGTSGVGLFQGARYQTSGVYRPQSACGMRSLGAQFCAICKQEYVLKLYRGGFGIPSAGIDMIEPGSEIPASNSPVVYATGTTRNFSASVLRPNPDTMSMQWYLDGVAIPGATSSSYNFSQASNTPSARTLELRAVDNSPLVQSVMAGNLTTHSRTWTIQVSGKARGDDRMYRTPRTILTSPPPPAPPASPAPNNDGDKNEACHAVDAKQSVKKNNCN